MIEFSPKESQYRGPWLQHPHTRELAELLAEHAAQRLRAVLNAARNSPDPAVRAAYAEHQAIEAMRRLLEMP